MLCSICIPTYKRPELLKKLLNSIISMNIPGNVKLQVVVVDNDEQKSAENILANIQNKKNVTFEYYVQPEKNISITRNKAVKQALGEYILFIDDDEIPEKNWLIYLLETAKNYNADAVFGRTIPRFNDRTPDWIKNGNFFNRVSPPTGSLAIATRSSNCIIKASLLKKLEEPFNPDYGITGGEDSHLFRQLKSNNAKYISSYEAIVYEFIPEHRTNVKWLIKRAYQTGNCYTRSIIDLFYKKDFFEKSKLFIRAFSFSIVSLFFIIITLPFSRLRIYWMTKLAGNLGHIGAIYGKFYKAYK